MSLLEHVNLNIPDEATARAFYIDGLGGVVNPRSSNNRQLHVNAGCSQFHLLHRQSPRATDPRPMYQPGSRSRSRLQLLLVARGAVRCS